MSLFYRRPLALFCCLFAAASIGGCFLDTPLKFGVSALCLLACSVLTVFCVLSKTHRARLLLLVLCFLFVASSFLSAAVRVDRVRNQAELYYGTENEVEMKVERVLSSTSFSSTILVDFSLRDLHEKALLVCDYPTNYAPGDILSGTVTVEPIGKIYEEDQYYKARTIFTVLISDAEEPIELLREDPPSLSARINRLNQQLASRISDVVGGDPAALLIALTLGERDYLSPSVSRDFTRLGLSHLLAISGMHLSIFLMLLDTILRKAHMRKDARCVILLMVALFYLALTGFSLSTVRSFIMVAFVYLAFLSGQQNDAMTSLFFALFLILAVSPFAVWDVGLWMSFLAVLGILVGQYFTEKIREALRQSLLRPRVERILASLLSAAVISFFANVFVCLPLSLCFDAYPLLAVGATMIVSPLVTVLLFFAPILLLSASLSAFAFLLPFIGALCKPLCHAILLLVSTLARLPHITVSLRLPFVLWIVVPFAVVLLALLVLPLRRKLWIPLVPLVAAVVFAGVFASYNEINEGQLTIDYLSGGESEILVLSTTQDAVICDLSSGADTYMHDAVALVADRYQTEISAVVYTHYHGRHVTTFTKTADRCVIRRIYLPYPENEEEYFVMYAFADAARKRGVSVVLFDRDKSFSPVPNISLNISSPSYLKRSTHPTFFVSISTSDKQVLYVAESAHESPKLADMIGQSTADYVILGTHGPVTKVPFSYPSFMEASAIFVEDPTVLSYIDPSSVRENQLIFGSDRITIRLEP